MCGGGGTVHSVFNNITSVENLLGAWWEFKRGKNKKIDILQFEFNLESELFAIRDELVSKSYKNIPYEDFYVYDPKRRHIHKAHVRDRIVHQAIYRVLYKIFDLTFIYDSYACRNNKGTHKGVNRLQEFIRKESKNHTRTVWVLKCDISKFFDSIDHNILKKILFKKIFDENTKWIIQNIIGSFEKNSGVGLPLGNVTSQLFANIYLNEFDQFVKHTLKSKYYIRYCDDFIIASHSKPLLEENILKIILFLEENLKLRLHPRKVSISKSLQGIDFLGYVVFPHHRVLRTNTKKRMFRILKNGSTNNVVQSYLGVLQHCKGYTISKYINKIKLS